MVHLQSHLTTAAGKATLIIMPLSCPTSSCTNHTQITPSSCCHHALIIMMASCAYLCLLAAAGCLDRRAAHSHRLRCCYGGDGHAAALCEVDVHALVGAGW